MAKFTVDLRNLQKRVRQLNSPNPTMQTGFKVIDLLTQNWDRGKGGDGRGFSRKISDAYAAKKQAAGRRPVINFSWTGDMRRAMTVIRRKKYKVDVTFSDVESMNKARGNFELRPTMMKIGAKIRRKAINYFYKKLKEA